MLLPQCVRQFDSIEGAHGYLSVSDPLQSWGTGSLEKDRWKITRNIQSVILSTTLKFWPQSFQIKSNKSRQKPIEKIKIEKNYKTLIKKSLGEILGIFHYAFVYLLYGASTL